MPRQPKPKQPEAPKPRGKRGPPKGQNYKENKEVLDKLAAAFAIDATIDEACFYAGIDPDTYNRWKKNNPSKYAHLEALRQTPVLAARETLAKAVKNSPKIALKYLERKRRVEFSTRQEVDHTTDGRAILSPAILDQIDKVYGGDDGQKPTEHNAQAGS